MSEFQFKALRAIRDHPGIRPARLAEILWPDSDGWMRPRKCGDYGVHRGGGMYVAAGQYIGKLCKRGLVYRRYKGSGTAAFLTSEGAIALQADDHQT